MYSVNTVSSPAVCLLREEVSSPSLVYNSYLSFSNACQKVSTLVNFSLLQWRRDCASFPLLSCGRIKRTELYGTIRTSVPIGSYSTKTIACCSENIPLPPGTKDEPSCLIHSVASMTELKQNTKYTLGFPTMYSRRFPACLLNCHMA